MDYKNLQITKTNIPLRIRLKELGALANVLFINENFILKILSLLKHLRFLKTT